MSIQSRQENWLDISPAFNEARTKNIEILSSASCECGQCGCGSCPFEGEPGPTFAVFLATNLAITAGIQAGNSAIGWGEDD